MERTIVNVNAKSKEEAIAGLELLLEVIKNSEYQNSVEESVQVTNEGNE